MKPFVFVQLLLISLFAEAEDSTQRRRKVYIDPEEGFLGVVVVMPDAKMRPLVNNHMNDLGFGVTLQYVIDPGTFARWDRETAFRVGGNLSYIHFGSYKTEVTSQTALRTNYGIVNLNGVIRIAPPRAVTFVPFLDLHAGPSVYFATSKWTKSTLLAENESDFVRRHLNVSLARGATAGIYIGNRERIGSGFSIRVSANWAGKKTYIVRESIYYNSPENKLYYQKATAPVKYIAATVAVGL